MTATTLAVCALAAYRAATLVTTDTITGLWRRRLARRHPPAAVFVDGLETRRPHPVVELVNCGRCVGWWTSGAAVAVGWAAGAVDGPGWFAAGWLAVAGAVTLLVSAAP